MNYDNPQRTPDRIFCSPSGAEVSPHGRSYAHIRVADWARMGDPLSLRASCPAWTLSPWFQEWVRLAVAR